ncbi:zinc finger C2HC domain-containing protein 1C [Carassius carassius]|uniref:zinc finger C2HC domain-containing protein 1C n=1 Tax=Carassius carassius TaxID=217509 RepID=UPI0028683E97|nr:zinc finger C2HC domain-containing protein 1C [Carassius carassius]XP_059375452.1 zinc finger C2HC domain-containing protein 1C [Carassius carassius]
MQTMPRHQFTQHFWEKETVSTKLPSLHREGMSRPSGTHHISRTNAREDQERTIRSTRDGQHPDNIHWKKHTHPQEQREYVPSRRASDNIFPLKPVLHKRAYSLSNVTKPEHPRVSSGLTNRHQQKGVRKLDALNPEYLTERTNPTKCNMHREQKLEKQTWLAKEIHSKEMMLQEKISKVEETLRRVQNERKERAKRDERSKRHLEMLKEDNRFYRNGYGDWEEERDRYGNEKWEFRDNMERWERGINGSQLEMRKESAKWRQPLMLEMTKAHKLEEMREWDEYEHTAKHRSREMSDRQNMGWDHVRRRRETHNLYVHSEDEDHCEVRKPNPSDSVRRDRSDLQHERRGNKEGLYRLTSKLRKEAVLERNPRQKGERLQQVELSLEEDLDASQQLIPCDVCHRCFARERLETHMRVCEKQRPRRKIFDMSQYRAKGTDLEEFMKTNSRSRTPELKKNNWRQKHEAFIQTMRQGRGSVPPQSLSNLNPEYVSCPHCGRRFAPGPAERHIPKCQNIKSRPPPPKQPHSATRRKTPQ